MWKACIALSLIRPLAVVADTPDWPRFRGPNGSGVSASNGLPAKFGRGEGLVWRTPVPPGGSSPVVSGKHLFLTAYEDSKRIALCLDALTGRLLWRKSVEKSRTERQSPPNDPATPTPVT